MKRLATLNAGDVVAYAAKFLKNTGQFAGYAPQRRGTFLSYASVWNGTPARWSSYA